MHSRKQYFSNNSRRKNLADLNVVILKATELAFLDLSKDGLSAYILSNATVS